MKKNARIILLLCMLSVAGVIALQSFWLHNYYQINNDRFEKDANLAFEDAVKKEFMLRCDTLEELLFQFLIDSSRNRITSKWSDKYQRHIYYLRDARDTVDVFNFSLKHLNLPITNQHDSVHHAVARSHAQSYRKEQLEQHTIIYDTQELGRYMENANERYSFDTVRLRPILRQSLTRYEIKEQFAFYYSDNDSLLNNNSVPDSVRRKYPVITRAFSSFRAAKGTNFVRATFTSSSSYLFMKMRWMLAGTLLLLAIFIFSLRYLFRSLQREKKLSAIKNDFISNITHELKTPVATISSAIEAMTNFDALKDPARTGKYLSISRNELHRLSGMIDEVLFSTVYERQDFLVRKEMIAPDQLIAEIIQTHSLGSEQNIHFTYKNNVGKEHVPADKLHLYNCFNNLVDNAIKYGKDNVHIAITVGKENGYALFTVKDDGHGIPDYYLPYVFEKFFRVPQGNRHAVKGYGLGLNYVRSIIEKHGGYCQIQSKINKGTTVTIALPI